MNALSSPCENRVAGAEAEASVRSQSPAPAEAFPPVPKVHPYYAGIGRLATAPAPCIFSGIVLAGSTDIWESLPASKFIYRPVPPWVGSPRPGPPHRASPFPGVVARLPHRVPPHRWGENSFTNPSRSRWSGGRASIALKVTSFDLGNSASNHSPRLRPSSAS